VLVVLVQRVVVVDDEVILGLAAERAVKVEHEIELLLREGHHLRGDDVGSANVREKEREVLPVLLAYGRGEVEHARRLEVAPATLRREGVG